VCVAAYPLYVAALLHRDTVAAGQLSYGLASVLVLAVTVLRLRMRTITTA